MYLPQQLILQKRDGSALSQEQLDWWCKAIADEQISDAQIAAFAMAVYFKGMSAEERASLTMAMRDSGEVMDWASKGITGPVVDKHSTGGLGDLTSLVIGPILAACGAYVPMISGRGLGHTGGTLDKLEAIPGYQVEPGATKFERCVRECGIAIVGQSANLAPADKRLYRVRDVTATVDSIDLICSSILSKKLAEGLDGLVMDVKCGSGAFMPDYQQALALAETIVEVAELAGVKCHALLTDMNQPLASAVGNALEIQEALACLRGERDDTRLMQMNLALAAEMLQVAGLASEQAQALQMAEHAIATGKALDVFGQMLSHLGGPEDFVLYPERYLAQAKVIKPPIAEQACRLEAIDCQALGMAVVALGGGRSKPGEAIDHSVGISDMAELGQVVTEGEALLTLHASSEQQWQQAEQSIRAALKLAAPSSSAPSQTLIYQRLAS